MATTTTPLQQQAPSRVTSLAGNIQDYFDRLTKLSEPAISWDNVTWLAFASLILIWAIRMYTTWATWGNLAIDSGHEAYVPAVLAQGKMLYRDVWWMYTPLAPYINAVLFRWFGIRLEVLYWAGSLSALASALLLFMIGKRLSSRLAGWTAGAVVLLEGFHASPFSFPLPYSFAAVYGCLSACFFLWCAVHAVFSRRWVWLFGAASSAAAALLLKMEFGVACYLTFAAVVAMAAFRERNWRLVLPGILALLPGLLICAAVLRWMISIAGVSFITQENISSWPTAYFMKAYGKLWLEKTGFSLTPLAFGEASLRAIYFAGILFAVSSFGWWKNAGAKSIVLRVVLLVVLLSCGLYFGWWPMLSGIFFPRDMVLYMYIGAALAAWFFLKNPSVQGAGLVTLAMFSALLASRTLVKMFPGSYPIYYNGPVILAFLMFLRPLIPRVAESSRVILRSEILFCMGTLAMAALVSAGLTANRSDLVELKSDRGSILVPSQVNANYEAAISFIKEANKHGEEVLSVPEDVGLYFFSGQNCPTRVFQFSPGIIAPGKMTREVMSELEARPVHYLLWSNRTYREYGTSEFGKDYDQTLGTYFTSRFHRVGPLVQHSPVDWQTKFELWQINSEPAANASATSGSH